VVSTWPSVAPLRRRRISGNVSEEEEDDRTPRGCRKIMAIGHYPITKLSHDLSHYAAATKGHTSRPISANRRHPLVLLVCNGAWL